MGAHFVDGARFMALRANAIGPANSPWPMIDSSPQQDSAVRAVIPIEPPQLDIANSFMAADGFHLRIRAGAGAIVTIFGSDDLGTWTELQTTRTATGDMTFVDPATPLRFYRVSVR